LFYLIYLPDSVKAYDTDYRHANFIQSEVVVFMSVPLFLFWIQIVNTCCLTIKFRGVM